MACQNLMLEAVNRGLGSVCIGRPTTFNTHKKKIKQLVDIPRAYEIPYLIAVGYPSLVPYKPKRKPLEEFMERIK